MDPSALTDTLRTGGGYAIAALALGAVVYLYRRVEVAQAELVATIKADNEAHRALLSQTIPLSAKLAEGIQLLATEVETLDRIAERLRGSP